MTVRAAASTTKFYGGVMSEEEVREFLCGPKARWLIKIAVLKDDGWPSVIPVWYQWNGEAFLVVGRKRSTWVHDLMREPRCAICIEELEPVPPAGANRKVLAQCTAEIVEGPVVAAGSRWEAVANEMASRYMGDIGIPRMTASELWERYLIRLVPRDGRLSTWQGIDWAPKYFDEGQRPDLHPRRRSRAESDM
jgi:nitroimidazol reductase NimA-like FMN-containing flavoprotein (pyridoxamine 5'-phosphate oxidase superfamily)